MSGTFRAYFEPIIETKMTSTNFILRTKAREVKSHDKKFGYYFRSTKFRFDNSIIQCVYVYKTLDVKSVTEIVGINVSIL